MNSLLSRNVWRMFFAAIAFSYAVLAQAASFDCAKAGTKVEHIICDTPEISKLDDELNTAYKAALKDEKQAEAIKQAQKQWMKERNGCADAECIKQSYEKQTSILDKYSPGDIQPPSRSPSTEIKTGQYKMISDSINVPQSNGISIVEEHAEVCSAFMKVLEALPPFPPMACNVQFPPEFTDFKTPEWKDADVWENRDLQLQLVSSTSEEERKRSLSNIKEYIDAGMLAYRITSFDIDGDGNTEQVLEISNGKKCDPTNRKKREAFRYGYRTYSLDTRKIDIEKNKFFGSHWSNESLFSYKGVTYYAALYDGITHRQYFGKSEYPDQQGFFPAKYFIRIYRPIPMGRGIKQSVALGCEYLYLPPKNKGGY